MKRTVSVIGMAAAFAAMTSFGGDFTWIGATGERGGHPALMVMKSFPAEGEIVRATLHEAGLGVYEVMLNGQPVGDEILKPGFSNIHRTRQTFAHDVTGLLKDENEIRVTVSRGYWSDMIGGGIYASFDDGFACRLEIVRADGTTEVIATDETWSAAYAGPLIDGGIYEGEIYDARLESAPIDWAPARVLAVDRATEPALGRVYFRRDLARRVEGPFTLAAGERRVVDFGQNCAACERFRVKGRAGTKLTIRHAEELTADGSVYVENLRSLTCETHYTLAGAAEGEEHQVRFTYYGFRYIELSADGPVAIEWVEQVPVTSVRDETAHLVTSDADVNRLIAACEWALRSNLVDVSTDCPQRDERLAWSSEALIAMPGACWMWDARDFYRKNARDFRTEQRDDGAYASCDPAARFGPVSYGEAGYGDAGVLIPYGVWKHYGDTATLAEHYASMARYADWLVIADGPLEGRWGDWLAYQRGSAGAGEHSYSSDPLMLGILARLARRRDFLALAEIAATLGRDDDAVRYAALAETAKGELLAHYFAPDGTILRDYSAQVSLAMALRFGVYRDEAARAKLAWALADDIEDHGHRLMTGTQGTAQIMHALSENGYATLAYDLLLNHRCPSWLYMIDHGATTLWERWDTKFSDGTFNAPRMNSFNHSAFSNVLDWMYRTMAGIKPNPEKGGFDDFVLEPRPDPRVRRVEASYRTSRGVIETVSEYLEDGTWRYRGTVPDGATATLILPDGTRRRLAAGTFDSGR